MQYTPVLPKSTKDIWEEEANSDHQHAGLEYKSKARLVQLGLVHSTVRWHYTIHLQLHKHMQATSVNSSYSYSITEYFTKVKGMANKISYNL